MIELQIWELGAVDEEIDGGFVDALGVDEEIDGGFVDALGVDERVIAVEDNVVGNRQIAR